MFCVNQGVAQLELYPMALTKITLLLAFLFCERSNKTRKFFNKCICVKQTLESSSDTSNYIQRRETQTNFCFCFDKSQCWFS